MIRTGASTQTISGNSERLLKALLIFIFISFSLAAQKGPGMDSLTIKKKAASAKEITLDEALTFWILNHSNDPRMPRFRDFYSDRTYTYFIRSGKSYKTLNSEISRINYKMIKGDSLRAHLFYNIIPSSDRDKSKDCSSAIITPTFKCKYVDSVSIELSCHYKVVCDFIPVVNKNYLVLYNLKNQTNEILAPAIVEHKK